MATINQKQDEIIENFDLLKEMEGDSTEYLIDLGKKLPPMDDKYKVDENIIKGCQSTVWLNAYDKDGKIFFEADSNTIITKGIISLLVNVYTGQTADDILNTELYFIDKIDLRSFLSSQRSNGLNAMIKQMKLYAVGYGQTHDARHNAQD